MLARVYERGYRLVPGVFQPGAVRPQALLYHNVEAEESPWVKALRVTISPSVFAEHISYLASRHTLVPFSRLCDGDAPQNAVALTFDDGYRSVLTVALPILERYRCPFKVFLNHGAVGARVAWLDKLSWLLTMAPATAVAQLARDALAEPPRRAPTVSHFIVGFVSGRTAEAIDAAYAALRPAEEPRLYLDDADVRALAQHELVELGSHSTHHYPLTRLGESELREEVVGGHQRLAARFPGSITGFAVPFGFRGHVTSPVALTAKRVDSVLVTAYGGPLRGAVIEGVPEIRRTPVSGNLGRLWYSMQRSS